MSEYFVQRLTIKDIRDIKNFEISLDENKRKHLIITGKNGCGKTSTLNEIDTLLNKLIQNQFAQISQHKKNIELKDASFISWQLCIIYMIAISITGVTCFSIKLYVSSSANLFQLICWMVIVIQKLKYKKEIENEITTTTK